MKYRVMMLEMMLTFGRLRLIKQWCLLVIFQNLKLITTFLKLIITFYINQTMICQSSIILLKLMHYGSMMMIIYMSGDLFFLIILLVISNIICSSSVCFDGRFLANVFINLLYLIKSLILVFLFTLPSFTFYKFFFLVKSFSIIIRLNFVLSLLFFRHTTPLLWDNFHDHLSAPLRIGCFQNLSFL